MVDSESVAVGGEVAAWVADLLVVGESGCEGEHAQGDADADTQDGAATVALERELAFAGPDRGFDPLPDRPEGSVMAGLVFAVGAQEPGSEAGHDLFELLAGEAFVSDDGVAVQIHSPEHLRGDLALGEVGRSELKADRHPVAGAQQVQPVAPEEAVMALAVAVGGAADQVRTAGGFARLTTGHRRAVKQPER